VKDAADHPRDLSSGGDTLRLADPVALGLVLVIFVTETVTGMLLFALAPQFPITGLGFSTRHGALIAGYALAAYGAAKMFGQPASGWLADRYRPREVMLGGLVLTLPVVAVMAQVRSAGIFVAMCCAFGLTLAVVWPAMYAAVGLRFAASVQGRLLALVTMGQLAGTIVGFGAGAVLIDHASYSVTFAFAFVMTAIATALAVLMGKGRRRDLESDAVGHPKRDRTGAFRALREPQVAALILLIMVMSTGVAMLQPDLKPYSDRVLHMKFSEFALLLVPPVVVCGVLLVPAGYVADRLGRSLPMIVGLADFAICLVCISFTRTPWIACAIACVAAAGYVLSLPAINAALMDVSSVYNRGLLTGLTTSIQAIGIVIGPLVGGVAVDAFGPRAPFRLSAIVIVIALLLAVLYGRREGTAGAGSDLEAVGQI